MIVMATQCFPPVLGGIEILMASYAREFAERGFAVEVFADGKVNSDDDRLPYKVHRFSGWKPLRALRKRIAIRRLVAARGFPRAFVTDSWKSLETLGQVKSGYQSVPVVCFAHGNEFPAAIKGRKASRIRRLLVAGVTVIANSRWTAERAKDFVAPEVNVVVQTPPIADQAEPTEEDLAEAERLWGATMPRVLTIARLDPHKGIAFVIESLPKLAEAFPSIGYVVAGVGKDEGRLKALTTDCGVEARVRFAGRVTGSLKTALYRTADLFVMPTGAKTAQREGFGIVFLEAAASGLPSVAVRTGGVPDAIVDGQTGVLCDDTSVAGLTATVRALLEDRERLADLSRGARAHGMASLWRNRFKAMATASGLDRD
jgi:phosphatidylinositol alpha-1,6-mannosyltransferase